MIVDDPWPTLPLPELSAVAETLRLRRWCDDDASALAAAWADPEVARWLDPPAGGVETARRWIAGTDQRLASGTAIDAAITVNGVVAGEVGFHGFDRKRRAALVGYWVGPDHRGNGFAATALAAATTWWFDTMGGEALVATCATANAASWCTAERAGFLLVDERDDERILAIRRPGRQAKREAGSQA